MRTLLPALLLLLHLSASADTHCRVVGITDGDTLTCLTAQRQQIKVRLAEIDTPEKAQPYGQRSKQALAALAHGKTVQLIEQGRDRYGRTIARAVTDTDDVNRAMIAQGAAWVYRQYNRDKSLLAVEAQAKAARRGLWALPESDIVPPWEWRKAGSRLNQEVDKAKASSRATATHQCGTKRYCKQMSSCAEARFFLTTCGVESLDRDRDGKPCEDLCN